MMVISNRQRGIGLLELMLSLTVLAVMAMVAIMYFQPAFRNQKVTAANAMLAKIYTASSEYVKSNQYNGTLSMNVLIKNEYLPTYYSHNPWGGNVDISLENTNQLVIKLMDIPKADCELLSKRLVNRSEKSVCSGADMDVTYELY